MPYRAGRSGILFKEAHLLTDAASGNSVYAVPVRRFRIEGQYA